MPGPTPSEHFFEKFEEKCKQLIEYGYKQLRAEGECDSSWGEEKFTEEMYMCMNCAVQSREYPYMDVDLENTDISNVTGEVGRIDFKVRKATLELNIYTYVECKLLSNDRRHFRQYRKNGLIRFLRGKYADRPNLDLGFMVGYIIKDNLDDVIKNLISDVNCDSNMNITDPLSQEGNSSLETGDRMQIRTLVSTHKRQNELGELEISHLMLDFT